MESEFIRIQNERVGYHIRADFLDGPKWLEILTFGQFIPPYANGTKIPQQVYKNLEKELDNAINQQNSVINKKKPVIINVLATATLQREAIINAMNLIQKYYL